MFVTVPHKQVFLDMFSLDNFSLVVCKVPWQGYVSMSRKKNWWILLYIPAKKNCRDKTCQGKLAQVEQALTC